jgi:hypothetical protein
MPVRLELGLKGDFSVADAPVKLARMVKEGDDLMAATRYAMMMLRYVRMESQRRNFNRKFYVSSLPRNGYRPMARRQFVTWSTLDTPYGTGSWAMIDNLLHVRSALGTEVADLGSLTPQSLTRLLMWQLSNEGECCG